MIHMRSAASYLRLRVPLNEADDDVRGDETSPAREQYALCLVLAQRLGLALGDGAGNAVGHLSNHIGRVCTRRYGSCRWLRMRSDAFFRSGSGQVEYLKERLPALMVCLSKPFLPRGLSKPGLPPCFASSSMPPEQLCWLGTSFQRSVRVQDVRAGVSDYVVLVFMCTDWPIQL